MIKPRYCHWVISIPREIGKAAWKTDCDHTVDLGGTPKSKGIVYCPYCGLKLPPKDRADKVGSSFPSGLGVIKFCPVCGSEKELEDVGGFLIEGVKCKKCKWADIDGGIGAY